MGKSITDRIEGWVGPLELWQFLIAIFGPPAAMWAAISTWLNQWWAELPADLRIIGFVVAALLFSTLSVWVGQKLKAWLESRRLPLSVTQKQKGYSMARVGGEESDTWNLDITGLRFTNISQERSLSLEFTVRVKLSGDVVRTFQESDRIRIEEEVNEDLSLITKMHTPIRRHLFSPIEIGPEETVPKKGHGILRFSAHNISAPDAINSITLCITDRISGEVKNVDIW